MQTSPHHRFRTYRQTLSATFSSPEDASAATLAFRDLPPGMDISISARGDDSTPRHLPNAQALAAAGAKGTYYLNASDPDFIASTVRPILALGGSVGIHTKTHPFPTQLTLGGLFDEILANRIAVESAADTPVNAFTLPFGVYKCLARPGFERALGESLRRTGIFGGGEFFENPGALYGLPPTEYVGCLHYGFDDIHPSQELFLKGVEEAEERFRSGNLPACGTHITMGTHSWADDAGMADVTRCFQLRTQNPAAPYAGRTWFCTENEFAASWIQARHTTIEAKVIDGCTATWTLYRPEPAELGDNVPLFLQFSRGPLSASIPVEPSGQAALPHAPGHAVPTRIDAVTHTAPESTKFPGLSASLTCDLTTHTAQLSIQNQTGATLGNFSIILRLPLCFNDNVERIDNLCLENTDIFTSEIPLTVSTDPTATEGPFIAAAQIDFTFQNTPCRLYATYCTILPVPFVPTSMRDACRVATALPALLWTPERIAHLSLPTTPLTDLSLFPSTRDPVYAPNSYHFHSDDPVWRTLHDAVPSDLRSQRLQLLIVEFESNGTEVLLDCRSSPTLHLNGNLVKATDAAPLPTLPGRNRIVLSSPMDHWCPRGNFALIDPLTHQPIPLQTPSEK